MRLAYAGAILLVVTLFILLALVTAYWPFQSMVQVIAPFLGIAILTSVGMSLLLTALLLPRTSVGRRERTESASTIDSLLEEIRKPR
jgi:hypothetical protein